MKPAILISVAVTGIIITGIGISILVSDNSSQNDSIRVAYFPNIGHAVPIVGIENGFFSESLGNQIAIKPKLFDSGPQVIESLFSKSIDIAYVGPGPAINGFLKSGSDKILILSGAASGGASFIAQPDSQITNAKDFGGKTIAAPQIGNTQDVSLRYYLMQNGLKPIEKGGDVRVYNVPNPEIYTLFTKGDIDGAWVPEPWATLLVNELGGKRIFFEEDLWDNKQFASAVLIARSDYISNNPEIISRWLESHNKTVNWINNNPKEAVNIFDKFMVETMGKSYPKEIISEAMSNLEITSDPIKESIIIFAERANSLGYLGRDGYNIEGIFYLQNTNSENMKQNG